MKGESGIFSWVIIGMAVLAVIASIALIAVSSSESSERIEKSRRRYLKYERMLKDAREEAKRLAQLEVEKSIRKQAEDRSRQPVKKAKRFVVREPSGIEKLLGRGKSDRRYSSDPFPTEEMNETDQEIVDVAQEASDARDFETVKDVADAALKSNDPRARLRAVETLGSFGEKALPQLADFLLDKHSEVANLAANCFELGVQDLKYESERVAITKLGMLSINDEDQLRSMAATLRMSNDRLAIIAALSDVILDGNKAQRAAAKEAYELETGEEWVDLDAADKWLQENYEPVPPEEPDEEDEPEPEDEPEEEEDDDGSGEEEFDDTNEEEQGENT